MHCEEDIGAERRSLFPRKRNPRLGVFFVRCSPTFYSRTMTGNLGAFEQPLEGIFRDGIPAPVLRSFAPLYQALPRLQDKVAYARDCYYWRASPLRCLDEDIDVVTAFMQASEASFRLCPQQSSTLLKCHSTEPAKALFFCRDEEWEWRSCLMDKTGIRFFPYANAPIGASWSNGGQTEDFHIEDRFYHENMSWWRRATSLSAIRTRELEVAQQRKKWNAVKDEVSLQYPDPTIAPVGLARDRT